MRRWRLGGEGWEHQKKATDSLPCLSSSDVGSPIEQDGGGKNKGEYEANHDGASESFQLKVVVAQTLKRAEPC
jgi:hypothetical protein